MSQSYTDFVEMLIELMPSLRSIRDEAFDYWSPEEPPHTTLLSEFAVGTGMWQRLRAGMGPATASQADA